MKKIQKVLIDITHPAHVHFFRNLIRILKENNVEVYLTGRDKDIVIELAKQYGLQIDFFGKAKKGALNLLIELIYRMWKLHFIIRKFKPDLILSIAGTFSSFIGRFNGVKVFIFYDTEHATVSNLLAYPFASCIYVPECYRKKIKWNHVRYKGFHQMTFLRPKYFQADHRILKRYGVNYDEKYVIIRFVSWQASHDLGLKGFTLENKIKAVREFEKYAKVFISSENELPDVLKSYQLKIDLSQIHHLMNYATLVFGESATMSAEAAVLGVPAIYVDPVGRGSTDELENRYRIVYNFTHEHQAEAIEKGVEVLKNEKQINWKATGKRIIEEKIDLTQYMLDLILNNKER